MTDSTSTLQGMEAKLISDIRLYIEYGDCLHVDSEGAENVSRVNLEAIVKVIKYLRSENARIELTQQSQETGQYD